MADKKQVVEQYYTPPPKLSGWESFRLFMWNGETSEFLGRTAGSWGKFHFHHLILYLFIIIISNHPSFGYVRNWPSHQGIDFFSVSWTRELINHCIVSRLINILVNWRAYFLYDYSCNQEVWRQSQTKSTKKEKKTWGHIMEWAAIFRFYVLHNQFQAFTLLCSNRYAILIHFCVAAHIHSQRWSGMHNKYTPKRWRICLMGYFIVVVVSGASTAATGTATAAVAVVVVSFTTSITFFIPFYCTDEFYSNFSKLPFNQFFFAFNLPFSTVFFFIMLVIVSFFLFHTDFSW